MHETPLTRVVRWWRRAVSNPADHVVFDHSVLPAADRRFCGPRFRDHRFYVQSAEAEAKRLVEDFGCGRHSRVLDVGCGQGRLAIGLLRVVGDLTYLGLDVDRRSVKWCQRHIQREHPCYRFAQIDVANERYNRAGIPLNAGFRFDLEDRSRDIIYLFSVFSHMREADMRVYLREFRRVLAPEGHLFLTTFVEEGVPPVSINPPGYVFEQFDGALHVVRYERAHLFSAIEEAGFTVTRFTHRTEVDGQSALCVGKHR